MADATPPAVVTSPSNETRGYQREMLEESFKRNIIIALDTGSGKTRIAILRIKAEVERQPIKARKYGFQVSRILTDALIGLLVPCADGHSLRATKNRNYTGNPWRRSLHIWCIKP